MKHEIKVEISKSSELFDLIEKCYYTESLGKLNGKEYYLEIKEDDIINYTLFKGLDGATVKVTNNEVIDGCLRFLIEDKESIKLRPISIYCIKIDDKYSFY